MQWKITPGKPLRGNLTLAGDKSLSHRAAILAAIADGESRIENFLDAGVTHPMLNALSLLGVNWHLRQNTILIQGNGLEGLQAPARPIFCGNSATTMRLLAGLLAAAGLPAVLDGSDGLRRRPMTRITHPLRQMGVPIDDTQGCAPLILKSRTTQSRLHGGEYHLKVASAQVKSALLLAGLSADSPLTVIEPALSRDHTELWLSKLGVTITRHMDHQQHQVTMQPLRTHLPAFDICLPGDFSSAAFIGVAALITPQSRVQLTNIGLNPTRTGLLDVLQSMGANIFVEHKQTGGNVRFHEPAGNVVFMHSPNLHGQQISGPQVVRMIDEFPILTAAAAYAQGNTEISDAGELRHKETDRIAALVTQFGALGVELHQKPDGFNIHGGAPLSGGTAHATGDHRLAMSLASAALATQGECHIVGAEIASESFPAFASSLQSLGADLSILP